MKKNAGKQILLRGIISVLLGFICAAFCFVVLIILFFALGLWGWSDGGERLFLERLERNTNITTMVSMIAAVVVFIFIVIKINQNGIGKIEGTREFRKDQ